MEGHSKTINNETFNAQAGVITKLRDMEKDIPHRIVRVNKTPTKYGTYVVTVFNEQLENEYEVYMPAYLINNAKAGDRFVYDGLKTKSDNSGHTYHSVYWKKCEM